jgi:hypothetical protein
VHWIKFSAGEMAYGLEHGYLVIREESGVRLGRFSVDAAARDSHAVVAREVLASALVFPLGRGPGRPGGEPELDALVASAKVYAERFESGESMVGPDWRGRAWQREHGTVHESAEAMFDHLDHLGNADAGRCPGPGGCLPDEPCVYRGDDCAPR